MRKKVGVYKICSKKKPERVYIGSSQNIHKRWNNHINLLQRGFHHSVKLQRHFNKYGLDDLVFEVMCECELDVILENEQFFLDAYNPWFNILTNSAGTRGYKMSEEVRQKMSEARTGMKRSEATKERMRQVNKKRAVETPDYGVGENNPFYGKHHTDESKKKMSESKKGTQVGQDNPFWGRKHTEETRRKMSENHRDVSGANHPLHGKSRPREIIEKLIDANSKMVVDTETGVVYSSIIEAARCLGVNYGTLCYRIKRGSNKTTLKLVA